MEYAGFALFALALAGLVFAIDYLRTRAGRNFGSTHGGGIEHSSTYES